VAATNGHRDRLSLEQLAFVGFEADLAPIETPEVRLDMSATSDPHWVSAAMHKRLDEQLEELARLRDVMPGWVALAREIVKDE
jgi:hypothetical protein